jgi:hypothetical protein
MLRKFAPLHGLVPLGAGTVSGPSFKESAAAGGLREVEWGPELYNGITDFTGRSYDTFSVGTVRACRFPHSGSMGPATGHFFRKRRAGFCLLFFT